MQGTRWSQSLPETDLPRVECESQSRRPTLAPTQRIRVLEQHLRYALSFLQELPERLRSDTNVNVGPVLKALQYWESGRSSSTYVAARLAAQTGLTTDDSKTQMSDNHR